LNGSRVADARPYSAVALLVALGIALAVPPARSAILRFFHIGSVTVERVETLPHAQQRSLVAGLGRRSRCVKQRRSPAYHWS